MKYTLRLTSLVAALALLSSVALAGGEVGNGAPVKSTAAKSATASHATTAKAATTTAASKVELIDINSASRDDLMKIPGIGEAIADKIIAGRPWKQKSDLLAKGVANKAQYAKMRTHIIAKQK